MSSRTASARKIPVERLIAGSCIAVWFFLQAHLVFVLNINWDEFLFHSQVFNYQGGRLTTPFQTFHIHLFGWLTALPLTEPDQIVVARLVMLLAQAGSAWCIYLIARALTAERHALIAVLAYLASGFVLGHGSSFRADPIATFLLMSAAALLFTSHRRVLPVALAGLLAGLAMLVTIKSALYIPAFAAALVHILGRDPDRRRVLRAFVVFALGLAIIYGVGSLAHAAAVSSSGISGGSAVDVMQHKASDALRKTVLSQELFPRAAYIVRWAGMGIVPLSLLAIGLGVAFHKSLTERSATSLAQALTCLLLAAPLLSLILYRNAYSYYFPFIFAPTAPAMALAAARLDRVAVRIALMAALMLGSVLQYSLLMNRDQSAQRAVIAAVHEIFSRPVTYVDRNSMIPSFPKVGVFMSSWGLESAAAAGRPSLVPAVTDSRPPLVIANSPALQKALEPDFDYAGIRLHSADEHILRENYIHHWGPLWVAGRILIADGTEQIFSPPFPGKYTLECTGPAIRIEGAVRKCGNAVDLGSGRHRLSAATGQKITLRWGDHLAVPAIPVPERPIYYGF